MEAFIGTEQVNGFRSIVIEQALRLYAATGMKANRAYTPSNMLRAASEITGLAFKRGQYAQAADAIRSWRHAGLAENLTEK